MAHGKQRIDIHQEIKKALQAKERFGESKHEAKRQNREKDGIYSYNTAKTYHKHCQQFAEYVREVSPEGRYTPLSASLEYAKEYIARENANPERSAYTVKMERSALAKLFGCTGKDLGEVRERPRADITRSRERTVISDKTGKEIKNPKSRAGHFSEKNHAELVAFCRSTGMRVSELRNAKGTDLRVEDGKYYLHTVGKGGRARDIPVRGDVKLVVEKCRQAGSGRIWDKIPGNMDVHHYRSQYATAYYREIARDPATLPKNERYCCRTDQKGVWFDREAMRAVSNALGHNRVSVIAEHYLRDVK